VNVYHVAAILAPACNCLKVYVRSGLAGKRVYSFASAAWRHHLLVLTEERKEKQIA